jgi:hypothetical protein
LSPRPVGRRASRLPGAAPRDGPSCAARDPGELVGEASLSYPGLSGDQGYGAAALRRRFDGTRQILELTSPADERRFAQSEILLSLGRERLAPRLEPNVDRRRLRDGLIDGRACHAGAAHERFAKSIRVHADESIATCFPSAACSRRFVERHDAALGA